MPQPPSCNSLRRTPHPFRVWIKCNTRRCLLLSSAPFRIYVLAAWCFNHASRSDCLNRALLCVRRISRRVQGPGQSLSGQCGCTSVGKVAGTGIWRLSGQPFGLCLFLWFYMYKKGWSFPWRMRGELTIQYCHTRFSLETSLDRVMRFFHLLAGAVFLGRALALPAQLFSEQSDEWVGYCVYIRSQVVRVNKPNNVRCEKPLQPTTRAQWPLLLQ